VLNLAFAFLIVHIIIKNMLDIYIVIPEHAGQISAGLDGLGPLIYSAVLMCITQEYMRQTQHSEHLLFSFPSSRVMWYTTDQLLKSDITAG
jgi:hypothetical protein